MEIPRVRDTSKTYHPMHPPPLIARSASQLHNTKRLQTNAPQYKGRLYFLLTPQQTTFGLTKVNKLGCNYKFINKLDNAKTGLKLTKNAQKLTKSAYRNVNPDKTLVMVRLPHTYLHSQILLRNDGRREKFINRQQQLLHIGTLPNCRISTFELLLKNKAWQRII